MKCTGCRCDVQMKPQGSLLDSIGNSQQHASYAQCESFNAAHLCLICPPAGGNQVGQRLALGQLLWQWGKMHNTQQYVQNPAVIRVQASMPWKWAGSEATVLLGSRMRQATAPQDRRVALRASPAEAWPPPAPGRRRGPAPCLAQSTRDTAGKEQLCEMNGQCAASTAMGGSQPRQQLPQHGPRGDSPPPASVLLKQP